MIFIKFAKMALLASLVTASLWGGSMQANAQEVSLDGERMTVDSNMHDNGASSELVDQDDEAGEDQQSTSQSDPEWKYVPVRRFIGP